MPTIHGSVSASKCKWQAASSQPGVSGLDSWRRAVLPVVQRTCRTTRRTSSLGRAGASGRGALIRAQSTRPAASAASGVASTGPLVDWDTLSFGLYPTAAMYVATCERGKEWAPGGLRPYGPLEMSPAAGVLNYGQGLFEGMKAYRTVANRVVLFRPDQNAARNAEGALRMSIPPVPADMFVDAVKQVVVANKDYIPPEGKGSLYIRPLLIGTGPILGLAPAPEYTFVVYASPVAAYFKGGQLTPIDLIVETEYHRAAPGGTGGTKCIGNYSPVLKTQLEAKSSGFSDVVYLDARENKYIEEVSSCNIFVVKGKKISTPPLTGTILPGITRKSIIDLARLQGYQVEERPVTIDEAVQADELFCTGTAVVVVPVGSLTHKGKRVAFRNGQVGQVAQELYSALTNLQTERTPDTMGWLLPVQC